MVDTGGHNSWLVIARGDARLLGFTGKLCIHPAQLPSVTEGFAPSGQEVQWARTVLDAGEPVTMVDGQMVGKPAPLRAQRVMTAAQEHTPTLTPPNRSSNHRGP